MFTERLCITKYTLNPGDLEIGTHLAVISDLHDKKCPEIITILKQISPDFILVVGDTIERNDKNYDGYYNDSLLNIPVRRRRLSGNPGSKSPAEWEA